MGKNIEDGVDAGVSGGLMSTGSVNGALAGLPVTGRFAPTPSGRMHLGNVYSSLLAWLSARARGGRLLLRIEDLDPRTQSGDWTALLLEDLHWLGLEWDGEPVYQHDRIDLYRDALAQLEGQGLIYPCFCTRAELHAASAPHASDGTPVYAGTCRGLSADAVARRAAVRPPAMRLRVPGAGEPGDVVTFTDRTYGPQHEKLARECGDFLVRRSDGVFAYQLAVVVDDATMGVTEVVRGRDLLSSAARQIYLQRLLGYEALVYAHVPLLVAPEGRRLSKRDRDLDMEGLRERFGTPARLLGWLANRAGLTPCDEPQTAEQLLERFTWDAVRAHRDDIVVDAVWARRPYRSP